MITHLDSSQSNAMVYLFFYFYDLTNSNGIEKDKGFFGLNLFFQSDGLHVEAWLISDTLN